MDKLEGTCTVYSYHCYANSHPLSMSPAGIKRHQNDNPQWLALPCSQGACSLSSSTSANGQMCQFDP